MIQVPDPACQLVNGRTSYSFWISEPYRNVRRTVHLEIWNRSVRRTRVRPYWRSPYGGRVRRTSDVNFSETVCLIYIKISQILNIDVDQKLLKFHVNQTTRFRDIDVGSWPFVFAIRHCLTLLPYFVRHGTAQFSLYKWVAVPILGDVNHTWFMMTFNINFVFCLTLVYRRFNSPTLFSWRLFVIWFFFGKIIFQYAFWY